MVKIIKDVGKAVGITNPSVATHLCLSKSIHPFFCCVDSTDGPCKHCIHPVNGQKMKVLSAALFTASIAFTDAARCAESNYCNGHGTCVVSSSTCACFAGWGAETDLATIKNPDCSASRFHNLRSSCFNVNLHLLTRSRSCVLL
jgi:hypothetical protein